MSAPVTQKPVFKPEIRFEVAPDVSEERATIVHCILTEESFVRIWPSTYLVQEDGTRKGLLQAFNITEYPYWKWLQPGDAFTLVFEGLDKHCLLFDLMEVIPEPGGFHIENIERNRSDVYRVFIDG